jgi:hypothetical protein
MRRQSWITDEKITKNAGIIAGILVTCAVCFFCGYILGVSGRAGRGDRIEEVIAEHEGARESAERSLDGAVGAGADVAERLARSEEQLADAGRILKEAIRRSGEAQNDFDRADELITAIEAILIILADNSASGDTSGFRYGSLNRTH